VYVSYFLSLSYQFYRLQNTGEYPQAFQVEADVLKQLEPESCVAIPKLIYYGVDSNTGWPLLVTDKVGVGTLYEVTLPLAEHNRIQIMADLREAVAMLHRHRLVYFNWHPANVMWRQDHEEGSGARMRALLVDFKCCMNDDTELPMEICYNCDFVASAMNGNSERDLFRRMLVSVTCEFDLESLLYIDQFLKSGTLPWIDDGDENEKATKKKRFLMERQQCESTSQENDASEQSADSPKEE
jgi:serine/threonine protein kinase